MPDATVRYGVVFDDIPTLMVALNVRARQYVDNAASDIASLAISFAPVDTGALVDSIYITNGETSDYEECAGNAESANPDAIIVEEVLPEFVLSLYGSLGDGAYMSVVGVAVNYGIFNEVGTRYMAPRPFMIPATEIVRDSFVNDFNDIADV